jgi:hypothetical protein
MVMLKTLVVSFVLSPRAVAAAAAAIALGANVVLGADSASAAGVIYGGR